MGNLKGYLFWPPFLKVFCQKWKFGRAKEMSASAGIWTRVPRSKGSYAIQWATPLLIENQQKLASYNNFCFGPFLTKNFQKGNGQNRYIFELLTLRRGKVIWHFQTFLRLYTIGWSIFGQIRHNFAEIKNFFEFYQLSLHISDKDSVIKFLDAGIQDKSTSISIELRKIMKSTKFG